MVFLPLMKKSFYTRLLMFMVALAVGTLAGSSLLFLIPEVTFLWVLSSVHINLKSLGICHAVLTFLDTFDICVIAVFRYDSREQPPARRVHLEINRSHRRRLFVFPHREIAQNDHEFQTSKDFQLQIEV